MISIQSYNLNDIGIGVLHTKSNHIFSNPMNLALSSTFVCTFTFHFLNTQCWAKWIRIWLAILKHLRIVVTTLRGSQFFYLLHCQMSVQDHMQVALSLYKSHGWMNQQPRDNCLFLTSNDTITNFLSHYNVLHVFNSLSFLKHLSYVVTKLFGSSFATIKYSHVDYCSSKTTTPSL